MERVLKLEPGKSVVGSSVALDWWRDQSPSFGISVMDRTLAADSAWESILRNGRCEVDRALELTGMATGTERRLLEIGCGIGRLSFVLRERFGHVTGMDVSPRLLEQARARVQPEDNIEFQIADGKSCLPDRAACFETVFSYEVFHYVAPETLARYFHDVARLLVPGGEFVFELNTEPIRWRTRASLLVRRVLSAVGVRSWRGMPTAAGFDRIVHPLSRIEQQLADAGLNVMKVIRDDPRQTWVVAKRVSKKNVPSR